MPHYQQKLSKARKGIVILRKLYNFIPRPALVTIYKTFIRSHLDYGDIIYDQPSNASLPYKIESIQYNAALAITGTIRGTSREKIYRELGLESLSTRRWMCCLCHHYRVLNNKSPEYLFSLTPQCPNNIQTHLFADTSLLKTRTVTFKISFLPNVIYEWDKLDIKTYSSHSILTFKNKLLKTIRYPSDSIFCVHNPIGLKYLTRL